MDDVHDWNLIEADYRGAVMPISTICRVHGIERHRLMTYAASNAWTRDLASQVRMAVNEALYRAEQDDPMSDDDAITRAAAVVIGVVRSHRKDISALRGLVTQAMTHFQKLMEEGVLIDCVNEDGTQGVKISKSALVLGKTQGVATALDNLASAYARVVELERMAFGLDMKAAPSVGMSVGDSNGNPVAQMHIYLPDNHRDSPSE